MLDHFLHRLGRRPRIVLAREHQSRHLDPRQVGAEVELPALAEHPPDQHVGPPVGADDHVARQLVAREEGKADPEEIGERLLVHRAVEPLRHLARVAPAEPLVDRDRPLRHHPRDGRREHERAGMRRGSRRVADRDERAEAEPEHDRPLDPERLAELAARRRPTGRAVSALGVGRIAAAAAALIEVHDLRVRHE